MPADDDDNPALARVARKTTPAAALAALGIVYGDLGTSPLYALQAVAGATGGHFSSEAALGTLSLIFWALTITISVKYCLFVMRADNHGEGGILALMSMTGANWFEGGRILIVMGLFGAALLYGDGIITPAISVLSALEGLNIATDVFKPHVVFMAVAILLALFAIQSRGTGQISKASGPGNATVVRGHCGARYRRRFPPPHGDCCRRSTLRNRAADGARLARDRRARWCLSGDDWRRSHVCRHGPHRAQSDPDILVRHRAAGAAAQLCWASRAFPRQPGH